MKFYCNFRISLLIFFNINYLTLTRFLLLQFLISQQYRMIKTQSFVDKINQVSQKINQPLTKIYKQKSFKTQQNRTNSEIIKKKHFSKLVDISNPKFDRKPKKNFFLQFQNLVNKTAKCKNEGNQNINKLNLYLDYIKQRQTKIIEKTPTNDYIEKENDTNIDDQKSKVIRKQLRKKYKSNKEFAFIYYYHKLNEFEIEKEINKLVKLYKQLEEIGFKEYRIVHLILKYCEQKAHLRYILLICVKNQISDGKNKYIYIKNPSDILHRIKEVGILKYEKYQFLINQFLQYIKNVQEWIIEHNNKVLSELQNSIFQKKLDMIAQVRKLQFLPSSHEPLIYKYKNKNQSSYQNLRKSNLKYGYSQSIAKNKLMMYKQLDQVEKKLFQNDLTNSLKISEF